MLLPLPVVWGQGRISYTFSESLGVGRVVPVESKVNVSIDVTGHGVAENQVGKEERCSHDGWFE